MKFNRRIRYSCVVVIRYESRDCVSLLTIRAQRSKFYINILGWFYRCEIPCYGVVFKDVAIRGEFGYPVRLYVVNIYRDVCLFDHTAPCCACFQYISEPVVHLPAIIPIRTERHPVTDSNISYLHLIKTHVPYHPLTPVHVHHLGFHWLGIHISLKIL